MQEAIITLDESIHSFLGPRVTSPRETFPTLQSRNILARQIKDCEPQAFANDLARRIAAAAAHALSDFSSDETDHFVDGKFLNFPIWAERLQYHLLEQDVVASMFDTYARAETAKLRREFFELVKDDIHALEVMIALIGDWWANFDNPDLEAGMFMQNRWLPALVHGHDFDPMVAVQTFLLQEIDPAFREQLVASGRSAHREFWSRITKLYASPVHLGLFDLLRAEQGREFKKGLARENLTRAGYGDPVAQAQCLGAM